MNFESKTAGERASRLWSGGNKLRAVVVFAQWDLCMWLEVMLNNSSLFSNMKKYFLRQLNMLAAQRGVISEVT